MIDRKSMESNMWLNGAFLVAAADVTERRGFETN